MLNLGQRFTTIQLGGWLPRSPATMGRAARMDVHSVYQTRLSSVAIASVGRVSDWVSPALVQSTRSRNQSARPTNLRRHHDHEDRHEPGNDRTVC